MSLWTHPCSSSRLFRFADGVRSTYAEDEAGIADVPEDPGARLVGRGSYDEFVLGAAAPHFDEQTVTGCPNRTAYLLTLSDPRVAAVSSFHGDGLETHWICTDGEAEIDLGFWRGGALACRRTGR